MFLWDMLQIVMYHILKLRKLFKPYIAEAACEERTHT